MERRSTERVAVQFEAKVIRLNQPDQFAYGTVQDISNFGVCVILPIQFRSGEPVQAEMGDSTLLGHVVYSKAENSLFRTGIEVKEIRLGTTELSTLLARVLNEEMPGTPGLERLEFHMD